MKQMDIEDISSRLNPQMWIPVPPNADSVDIVLNVADQRGGNGDNDGNQTDDYGDDQNDGPNDQINLNPGADDGDDEEGDDPDDPDDPGNDGYEEEEYYTKPEVDFLLQQQDQQ